MKGKTSTPKKRRLLVYDLDKRKLYYEDSNEPSRRYFKNAEESLCNYMTYVIGVQKEDVVKSPGDWIDWGDNNDDYYVN